VTVGNLMAALGAPDDLHAPSWIAALSLTTAASLGINVTFLIAWILGSSDPS